MPRYTYECLKCKKIIEAIHAIGDRPITCIEVSNCTDRGDLAKILNTINIHQKKPTAKKTGDTVKSFIEEATEELQQQKKDLKTVIKDISKK